MSKKDSSKKAAPAAIETAKAAKRGKRGNPAYAPKATQTERQEPLRLVILTPIYKDVQYGTETRRELTSVTFVEGGSLTNEQINAIVALSPVGTLEINVRGEKVYGIGRKAASGVLQDVGQWVGEELVVPSGVSEIIELGLRRMAAVARRQATNRAADVGPKQHAGKSSLRDAFQALVDKGV